MGGICHANTFSKVIHSQRRSGQTEGRLSSALAVNNFASEQNAVALPISATRDAYTWSS